PLRAVVKRALLLGMRQETMRGLAFALEDKHDLLGPETAWLAPPPPSACDAARRAGTRLTQLMRSIPYALDGEQDPLIQIVLSAQSSASQLLAAASDDEALSALVGLGALRVPLPSTDRWKPATNGDNAGSVVYETLEDVSSWVTTTLSAHRTA